MSAHDTWETTRRCINSIYAAVGELEATFPGRKFTPDGHLVGSIGEVAAAYIFDLELNPASTAGYDALSKCGKRVEIKLTQGKSVALREAPEFLVVLVRPKSGLLAVVYNGPGISVWHNAGKLGRNGQRPIGISKLQKLQQEVPHSERLRQVRELQV